MDIQQIALFNGIAGLGRTLFDITQGIDKLEIKAQLMSVYDDLMSLKVKAGDLEDANRDLREKLRFKEGEFEWRAPFYYRIGKPDVPLCPKCYSEQKASPVDAPYQGGSGTYRKCLVCDKATFEQRGTGHRPSPFADSDPGPWS